MSNTGQDRYAIHNVRDRYDRISQLPDCIHHYILSFIPTKEVLKTSILSKSWKYLWTSVSNLDFDDTLFHANKTHNEICFVNFVEHVLLLRDASNIDKFRLSCRVFFNALRINSWITYALLHNVQELNLCVFVEDQFVLPSSLFCSQILTSLKIEMNCVLELPNNICFPCLKMLHLSLITFPDDETTQKLFMGCRVLEELVILDCDWVNLKSITISSSTLKRFTIDDLPYFGPPDGPGGCKIEIYASNLVNMNYAGYPSNEIVLCDVSSLVNAYISVPVPHTRKIEVATHVINLLNGLSKVVSLWVSDHTIESLVFAGNLFVHLPVFKNLTYLELIMEIGNPTFKALMKLLSRCPNLQYLCFSEGFNNDIYLDEKDLVWSSLPKCISCCLKTLSFHNLRGYDSEIRFLNCVLRNALVLEKMVIVSCENLVRDRNRQKEVKKALQATAKGKSCVVTFL
ncbi:F-box/LRR-repeat protein At4g14103-like [Rutidosis leptorrhynchoides]|uniref:F-box/LRR-repeat protein At4g14103-like n=1 Tax=Rutidosis leptorrhynchoides TaxID=125765 RepID=UPI003A99B303